jgi:hypothetical protein
VIDVGHGRAAFFALCFGSYHALLGLINFAQYERPILAAAGLFLYVTVLFLVTRFPGELRLPTAMTAFALFAALAIPALLLYSIGESSPYQHHTWFVAGIGSVMAILAWRNRTAVAWTGMIAMVACLLVLGGAGTLLASGVIGSLAIVAGSQGAARALKSAQRASAEFLKWRLEASLESKDDSIRRAGSQVLLMAALDSSLPLLQLIQQKEGKMTSSDSKKLLLAEAGIRDQIRAKNLQDAGLIAAVLSARKRGVEVQLSDDGGVDLLEVEKRASIFKVLAQTLSGIKAGKVVIRSVAGESWTVSLFSFDSGDPSQYIFLRL